MQLVEMKIPFAEIPFPNGTDQMWRVNFYRRYVENGNDPRNYRVTFKKVKNILGFEPKYTLKDGVDELVDALEIGLYKGAREKRFPRPQRAIQ